MGADYVNEIEAFNSSEIAWKKRLRHEVRRRIPRPGSRTRLVKSITELATGDHFKFMEVCGGHTHTIYRHGIEHLLPETVELVHGPGCPVCVIPMGRVDDAMWLAEQPDVIFTTFGDMMRVPGSKGNLIEAKARGADVRFVYSPLDALKVAVDNPDKHVVFFAVGFETTAPSTAVTLVRARALGVKNFSVYCNHVTIVPPIKAILESPDLRLSGFLGPGHVSTVVGIRPYRFVPEVYGKPMVVAGFEPLDILASVHMLLQQIREGRCEVENQYTRIVRPEGNTQALKLMSETFELRPHFEWRGLGFISQSALKVHRDYAEFDAESSSRCLACGWPTRRRASAARCSRASSSRGSARCSAPPARRETPIGTCMVSPEGACAAYYNFGRLHRETAQLLGQRSPSSPFIARDVEIRAQRTPDIARIDAVLDGLRGGAPAEAGQHVVDEHRRRPDLSELALDEIVEFRQPHAAQPTPSARPLHGTPVPDLGRRRGNLRPAAPPPGRTGDDNTSRTAAANASAVNGRTSTALPCRTTRLAISHWSPPPGTVTSGTPASSVLDTTPCPPPHTITSACDSSSSWRPSPTTAHGGTGASGPLSRETTTRDPSGSASPGVSVSNANSARPRAPVVAVDGATSTTGPVPGGISSRDVVGSKCSGPTTTASAGQSGRGTSSAGSVAIRRRSGPGSVAGKPIAARAAARWRTPLTP